MKPHIKLINRINSARATFFDWLSHRSKQKFYLYLAAAFTVFALLDTSFLHITSEMRADAFDMMVRNRLAPTPADPDIVIVDIDEASLAAMSKDYGRWPWPRKVMGKLVEQVEKQHPKAVVFDIMFSDPDVMNPASDAYFNEVIAKTDNTYFPLLQVAASRDAKSEMLIAQIPSATPLNDETFLADAKISVVLPYFEAVRKSGRFGTQNIVVDSDGVVRAYPVYLAESGWKIPSLPARIGQDFGWAEPKTQQMLLNWRGNQKSYQHISFSDVFLDRHGKQAKRPRNEFKDKIIIIGSTAPNLFNLLATPIAAVHPGVEVLATSIDNYKNGDSLHFPEAPIWYLLITLTIIWLTAWAFYRRTGRYTIDRLFGLSQGLLIVFIFVSINFGNTFINLSGPLMLGIAYFTLARLYGSEASKVLDKNLVQVTSENVTAAHATLMLIRFDAKRNVISDRMLSRICDDLGKLVTVNNSIEALRGMQPGLWGLFEKTIAISWIAASGDESAQQAIRKDVHCILEGLPKILMRTLLHVENATTYVVHQGDISGGDHADEGWRNLFAETMLRWGENKNDRH